MSGEDDILAYVAMIEIDHPDGMGRFWLHTGVLEFEGNNFYGVGDLGRIEKIVSSTEIEVTETRFVLSGVDPEIVAGLDDSVKGRTGNIYEAELDRNMRVRNRVLLAETELDYQIYAVQADGKAEIAIVAHGGLFFLLNRSAAKWSPEEMKARFPGETGFDEVHLQEDMQDDWRAA